MIVVNVNVLTFLTKHLVIRWTELDLWVNPTFVVTCEWNSHFENLSQQKARKGFFFFFFKVQEARVMGTAGQSVTSFPRAKRTVHILGRCWTSNPIPAWHWGFLIQLLSYLSWRECRSFILTVGRNWLPWPKTVKWLNQRLKELWYIRAKNMPVFSFWEWSDGTFSVR